MKMKNNFELNNLSILDIANALKNVNVVIDQIALHIRNDLDIDQMGLEKLTKELQRFNLRKTIKNEYIYGEKLCIGNVNLTIIMFNYSDESLSLLAKYSEFIFDWDQPALPENLTLLYKEEVIFYTIAHESFFKFLNIEDDKLKKLLTILNK